MLWHDSCHFELSFIYHQPSVVERRITCCDIKLYDKKQGPFGNRCENLLKNSFFFHQDRLFFCQKTAWINRLNPGVPIIETRVRERCRPGSARSRSGNAEKFIRYTRGTFMPSFCILSSEKRHFLTQKTPPFCQWLFCLYKHKQCIIHPI